MKTTTTVEEEDDSHDEQIEDQDAPVTKKKYSTDYTSGGSFFRAATLGKLGSTSESPVLSVLRRLKIAPSQEEKVFFRPYCVALAPTRHIADTTKEKHTTEQPPEKPTENYTDDDESEDYPFGNDDDYITENGDSQEETETTTVANEEKDPTTEVTETQDSPLKRHHDDENEDGGEPPAKISKSDSCEPIINLEPDQKKPESRNIYEDPDTKTREEDTNKNPEPCTVTEKMDDREKEVHKENKAQEKQTGTEKTPIPKDLEKVIEEAHARAKRAEKELVSPPAFRPRKMEKSGLPQAEHKLIYNLIRERKPLSPQVSGKIKLERERYHNHFFKEAWENKVCFYWLNPIVLENFEHYSDDKKRYALFFPRTYKRASKSNIREIRMPCTKPQFNHRGKIFECNSCPEFIERKVPYDLLHFKTIQKEHTPLLQDDVIVESWIRRSPCNVVITASALTTMFNLWGFPNVTHEWTVPCFVKSGPHGMKTLYINKPFLKRQITPREKNTCVFKRLFESSGVSTRGERAHMKLCHSALEPDFSANTTPYCRNDNRGLLYELWSLDEISLLVRSRANVCHNPHDDKGELNFAGLFTKLHYCTVNKRREAYCQGETASWWMRTALHPKGHSKAIVAHVNPLSGSVLEVSELELSQIVEKAPFMAEYALNFLKYVFTNMLGRGDGSYVLQCWMSGSRNVQTFTVFEEAGTEEEGGRVSDVTLEEGEVKEDNLFDLHENQRTAGATATDEIPYLPPVWVPKPNRIPETLPIDRGERQQRRDTENYKEKFCYEFALKGKCSNPECKFPHKIVSDEEKKQLILRKEELFQEKKKEKKRERNKRKQKNKRERERAAKKRVSIESINTEGNKNEDNNNNNNNENNDDDEDNFFDSCSSSEEEEGEEKQTK